MEFDYTAYEYRPECTEGCGSIAGWMPSVNAASGVGHTHETQSGHHWRVQQRMREDEAMVSGEKETTLH